MSDTLITVIFLLAVLVLLPIALLLLRDRFDKPSPQQIRDAQNQLAKRLKCPEFEALERHYCCEFPECVKQLYSDMPELLQEEFEVADPDHRLREETLYVAFYQPADLQTVEEMWPGNSNYFAFANDGCGDEYLIDPNESDPAVLLHNHETGEKRIVAQRFTDFMRWNRILPKD